MTTTQEQALSKWAHLREQDLPLPSGAGIAVVLAVDLTEAVTTGRIPNPLRGIAIKAESGGVNPAQLSEEELQEWFDLKCETVVLGFKALYEAKVVKKKGQTDELVRGKLLQSGPLVKDWVAAEMPPADRDRIFSAATHILTTNELMGIMGLASFRPGAGLSDAAQNGAGNEPSAE